MRSKRRSIPMATQGRRRPSEAGFSLVEGLMAAALLLVVAVSVLPLFMRALESNIRGGRSSQVSALVTAELEAINQSVVDRPEWQLTGGDVGVRETGTLFWDMGEQAAGGNPAKIGDEGWIDVDGGDVPVGLVLWQRRLDVRKYSMADVHSGVTSTGGVVGFETLGDPRFLDSPLATDDDGDLYNAHLTEFRVHIVEDRDGKPAEVAVGGDSDNTIWMGQRMTIGHFRTF